MKKWAIIIGLLLLALAAAWVWGLQCGGASHNALMRALNDRVDAIATKIDARSDGVEQRIDARCEALERKLDILESKLDKLIDLATPKLPDGMKLVK